MVLFPHAKINLGLQVTEKRNDGFHDIISCLYPIGWCDVLELIEKEDLRFTSSGLDIPGSPEDNLCIKAYHLIKNKFDIPPVHIHLHKVVPIGAGLAGGSSDAVFTLIGLRKMFDLTLSETSLHQMASKLGSDCVFFIEGKPVMASGKGDELEDIELSLPDAHLVVVTPPVQVNTGNAYSMLTPAPPSNNLRKALTGNISQWQRLITNDFEGPVFRQFPLIAKVKDVLLKEGALFASLSGSGSSVFGIFKDKKPWRSWFDDDYSVWEQTF